MEPICDRCLAIDFGKARVVPKFPHSTPIDEDPTRFTLSPTPNCPLCRLLSTTLFDVDHAIMSDPRIKMATRPHILSAVSFLHHCPWTPEKANGAQDCRMLVAPGGLGGYPGSSSAFRRGASGYVACLPRGRKRGLFVPEVIPERFNVTRARKWLHNCHKRHGSPCNQRVTPVPGMKVIDCESLRVVRAEPDMVWVALSYVWGHERTVTYPSVTEPGPLPRSIPVTVQHAIEVTRSLGRRYLWVDRYCINQQDEAEKKSQIAKMDIIYHGADLTLIAAAGQDETFGLPGIGETRRKKQQVVELDKWIILSTGPDPIYETKTSRWASRGWTFQEAMLSRRRLVFTERQAWFECGRGSWMEALGGLEYLDKWQQRRWKMSVMLGPNLHRWFLAEPKDLSKRWWSPSDPALTANLNLFFNVIKEYSKRELTFDGDSLHAVAGVCSYLRLSQQKVSYLLGIPYVLSPSEPITGEETYFCYGLSWFHSHGVSPRRKSSFPSWTWAGWAGAVEWLTNRYEGAWPSKPRVKHIRFEENDGVAIPIHSLLNTFSPPSNQSSGSSLTLCFEARRVSPSLFSCAGRKQIPSESSGWGSEEEEEEKNNGDDNDDDDDDDDDDATSKVSEEVEASVHQSNPPESGGVMEAALPDLTDWTHWQVGKHWLWERSQPPDCSPTTFMERLEKGTLACFLLSDYIGNGGFSCRRCLLVVERLGNGMAQRVGAILLNREYYTDETHFFDHENLEWETVRLV